jgi:hypothetical protein
MLATLPLDIMFGNIGGGNAGDRLRLLAFLKVRRLPNCCVLLVSADGFLLPARRRGFCACRACFG